MLEPKEKGGEVTLQQDIRPCIIVDVEMGKTVTINNTRMLLRGLEKPQKQGLARLQDPHYGDLRKAELSRSADESQDLKDT